MIDFKETVFLETSASGAFPNRLNERCRVLLEENPQALDGQRVLDLASHDGRFSWASLKLGAKSVVGVEGRQHLVEAASRNVPEGRFVMDDLFRFLEGSQPGQYDTLLCFGFLYHTLRHIELFNHLKRLKPRHFILDTAIVREPTISRPAYKFLSRRAQVPVIAFLREDHTNEANTIDESNIIGRPSTSFIEMMLDMAGYRTKSLVWRPKSWENLQDYKERERVSFLAKLKS